MQSVLLKWKQKIKLRKTETCNALNHKNVRSYVVNKPRGSITFTLKNILKDENPLTVIEIFMKLSEKVLPKALKNKQQAIEVNIVYNIELNFSAYDDWEYLAMNTSESKLRQRLISSLSNICSARKKTKNKTELKYI